MNKNEANIHATVLHHADRIVNGGRFMGFFEDFFLFFSLS